MTIEGRLNIIVLGKFNLTVKERKKQMKRHTYYIFYGDGIVEYQITIKCFANAYRRYNWLRTLYTDVSLYNERAYYNGAIALLEQYN